MKLCDAYNIEKIINGHYETGDIKQYFRAKVIKECTIDLCAANKEQALEIVRTLLQHKEAQYLLEKERYDIVISGKETMSQKRERIKRDFSRFSDSPR